MRPLVAHVGGEEFPKHAMRGKAEREGNDASQWEGVKNVSCRRRGSSDSLSDRRVPGVLAETVNLRRREGGVAVTD